MTKSEQELKACRKKYSTLARETAKGMWPGKGSTGQNTEIILDTILEVIRQECMASKPTLEEVLVGLAEKENVATIELKRFPKDPGNKDWILIRSFNNSDEIEWFRYNTLKEVKEAALAAKEERDDSEKTAP